MTETNIAELEKLGTAGFFVFGPNICLSRETCRKAPLKTPAKRILHDAFLQSPRLGYDQSLEKLKEEDLPFLCESAAADACAPGNPRAASLADFEAMFRKLM